ncbi:MAG: hypothetical protein JXA96_14565 [Sedimentisphaerales bacterium]|nr:hypothetical protein [Sedimentisphaerales bacterium]
MFYQYIEKFRRNRLSQPQRGGICVAKTHHDPILSPVGTACFDKQVAPMELEKGLRLGFATNISLLQS